MSTNRTEVVKVRVSAAELEWLREMAMAEDRSVSAIVRRALHEYYARHGNGQRRKRRVRGSA